MRVICWSSRAARLSRAEVVKRLRFIKPATSFRSGYAYDNVLYIVAGHVIDLVSGQPYEDYVREHLFKPAGMLHSTSDEAHRFATANRAFPHARTGGAVRGIGPLKLLDEHDNLAPASTPAGLLAISANDMARWLQIQLAKGKLCPRAGGCSARNRVPRCGRRRPSSPSGPRCPASRR